VETMNVELRQASRLAGMAEVATGVLHNVGNVLNSVNVSAGVIGERIKKSRVSRLKQVAQMFQEHSADLGEFLTRDEKGSKVPAFLGQLAENLNEEHGSIAQELQSLAKGIEHIKEIVGAQQRHANSSAFIERVNVHDLIDDALRIHTGSLARRDITVVREFGRFGAVVADKHKLLQVMVNLIANAASAMEDGPAKTLTVRTELSDQGMLKIFIKDTGCGIPAENLSRVFEHGFTTKTDGHGFGLHSSALAAVEMKGCLTAESDGAGKGATFILQTPVTVAQTAGTRAEPTGALAA
jgi:two-component system, NtrC family, sensor kinase